MCWQPTCLPVWSVVSLGRGRSSTLYFAALLSDIGEQLCFSCVLCPCNHPYMLTHSPDLHLTCCDHLHYCHRTQLYQCLPFMHLRTCASFCCCCLVVMVVVVVVVEGGAGCCCSCLCQKLVLPPSSFNLAATIPLCQVVLTQGALTPHMFGSVPFTSLYQPRRTPITLSGSLPFTSLYHHSQLFCHCTAS